MKNIYAHKTKLKGYTLLVPFWN